MITQNQVGPSCNKSPQTDDKGGTTRTRSKSATSQQSSKELPERIPETAETSATKRKKKKHEKRKEKQRKMRQQQSSLEQEKIMQLRQIVRRIYEENDTCQNYVKELKEIDHYIDVGKVLLRQLNNVISDFVEKTPIMMEYEFDNCLKEFGLKEPNQEITSYETLLKTRPLFFKKVTDCIYYRCMDVTRSGANVHSILDLLNVQFNQDRKDYDYQDLDYDVLNFLVGGNIDYRNIVNYAFKCFVKRTKIIEGVSEQSVNRMMEIFRMVKGPFDDNEDEDDEDYQFSEYQEYSSFQDHSYEYDTAHSQEQEKSSKSQKRKKRKRNKKKKKLLNPQHQNCENDLLDFISPEEKIEIMIQKMEIGDMEERMSPPNLSSLFINALNQILSGQK